VDDAFMKPRLMPNPLLFVFESSLVGFPDHLMEHEFLAQRLMPHEHLPHIQHATVADNTPENGSVEQQTTPPDHADPPESASQSVAEEPGAEQSQAEPEYAGELSLRQPQGVDPLSQQE
jgi:hypothetical protein